MSTSVRIDKRVMNKMTASIPTMITHFLDAESEVTTNNIKLSFNTSPPGRTYKRGSVYHVASLPQYPPNVDTGALRNSIRWERRGKWTRWIIAGTDHAVPLELGTEKMAPRPFMVPQFVRLANRLADDMKRVGIFR